MFINGNVNKISCYIFTIFYLLFSNYIIAETYFKEEPLLPSQQELDVIFFSPKETISARDLLNNSTEIIMIFNQPVIPLTLNQDLEKYKNFIPFRIMPSLEGEIKWYGTTTVGFKIKKGLLPDKKYTVIVNDKIK